MRLLLLASLVFVSTLAVAGPVVAEDDDLVYRTFDVSMLTKPRRELWGPTLGMTAPNAIRPERRELPEPRPFVAADALVDLVRERVDPRSWEELDGVSVEVEGGRLAVRHRPEVIERVAAFLRELTAEAQDRVLLAIESTEAPLADFPAAAIAGNVTDAVSLELPPGYVRFAKATRQLQFVVDYQVEIAQASNISEPVVVFPEEGFVAEVRASPTMDGDRVLVEGIVQRGRYGDVRRATLGVDEECFNKPFRSAVRYRLGTIDLPVFDQLNLHWTAIARNGESIEIPVCWAGRQTTLRIDAVSLRPAQGGHVLDVSPLAAPGLPFRVGYPQDQDPGGMSAPIPFWPDWAEEAPFASAEALVERIHTLVRPEYFNEHGALMLLDPQRIVLPPDPAVAQDARAFVRERESDWLRPVRVDLRVYAVQGRQAIGGGAPIAPDAARLVAAARLPTLSGRIATAQIGSTLNFIADYDAEVAQEARISDPEIGQRFEGLVANVTPYLSDDGRLATVALEMLLAMRTLDPDPPSLDAQFLGPLDRVATRRFVVDTDLIVPMGGAYHLDLGPVPDAPSERFVLQVSVEMP